MKQTFKSTNKIAETFFLKVLETNERTSVMEKSQEKSIFDSVNTEQGRNTANVNIQRIIERFSKFSP